MRRSDGLYVPDLIYEEVSAAFPEKPAGYSSGGRVVQIQPATSMPSQAAQPPPSDPTITVLWAGVATSVAGLALQAISMWQDKKEK